MRKRIISMLFVLSAFIVPASVQAQWVVSDPGNLVQGIVNSVNEIVETSETAQNALSTWKETSKIFEQGREYYDKLRKVNDLISGSEKVKESVLMLGDISEIYVNNFGKMLTDNNFSQRELNAIAAGYNTIMKKSSRSITELKNMRAGCPSSLGRSIISVAAGSGVAGCLEKTEHRVWKSEEKAPFEKAG